MIVRIPFPGCVGWVLLLLQLPCLFLVGCTPDEKRHDPPLRPLVYTESPTDEPLEPIPGYEMWFGDTDPTAYPDEPPVLVNHEDPIHLAEQVDLSTPEALAHAVYWSLIHEDEALMRRLIMSAEVFAEVGRRGIEGARHHYDEAWAGAIDVLDVFRGELESEQRSSGFGSLLELEGTTIGSRRLPSGERTEDEDAGTMILGTELRARLRNSDQVFIVRLPRIMRNPTGEWQLADAPEVGPSLLLFVRIGFQLDPTMLAFEHYPIPLFTGNYWEYRVRSIPRDEYEEGTGQQADVPDADADLEWEIFRDEVVARDDFDGYSLVRIRRSFQDPERRTQWRRLLITPRQVYECNSDCRRNINDVAWLLSHASGRTPEFVFPLNLGMAWRAGGRPALDTQANYQTWSEYSLANTPAGVFESTVQITRSITAGREHRLFAPGIGVVLIRLDGATDITLTELVEYRIIP